MGLIDSVRITQENAQVVDENLKIEFLGEYYSLFDSTIKYMIETPNLEIPH